MEVYMDNSATTRTFPEVAELMTKIMCEDYGNPSSLHMKGVEAEKYLRYAKETLARILKVEERELLFTSGGTESDNMALIGCALANCRRGNHLITTQIEHPAILQTMRYLETQGYRVTYLPVDPCGRIRLEDLRRAMTPETILVSIMHTNNEIGALQPIEEAGALIKQMNPDTLFHVDAVQGFGKSRIYPKKMHIDLLSVSGHKIHAPKGVGFLYIRDGVKIRPILFGGGQQKGMRSGTDNVPGIAGLGAAAADCYKDFEEKQKKLRALRNYFIEEVEKLPDIQVNGPKEEEKAAPQIVSVSFRGVRSEVLLHALEERGIYVSSGSACSSNKKLPVSAVLKEIHLESDLLDSTLRFSFCNETTKEELDYCLENLKELLPVLRKYARH